MIERYYTYKHFLMNRYGEKVYKLPIQIPVVCPNRDPERANSGCAFCSSLGTGFESMERFTPINEQLAFAKSKVNSRYQANKFIGYFQNYTNTTIPVEKLIDYLDQVVAFGVVGIDIATRPDCLSKDYLKVLSSYKKTHNIDITFEIGLQIANDQILSEMNRGHTVRDFIDGMSLIHEYDFSTCVHLILNLPNSTLEDVRNTVSLLNQVNCDVVKLHSLYIPNDCALSQPYLEGNLDICSSQEYVSRVVYFISHIHKSIAISRLVSRIPEENALFSNWGMSWWKVYNEIQEQLEMHNIYQGASSDSSI
jgi:uncharacterized protein